MKLKNKAIKVCGECEAENLVKIDTYKIKSDRCTKCGSTNLWLKEKDYGILRIHRR
jgi:ribosomal protein L40E